MIHGYCCSWNSSWEDVTGAGCVCLEAVLRWNLSPVLQSLWQLIYLFLFHNAPGESDTPAQIPVIIRDHKNLSDIWTQSFSTTTAPPAAESLSFLLSPGYKPPELLLAGQNKAIGHACESKLTDKCVRIPPRPDVGQLPTAITAIRECFIEHPRNASRVQHKGRCCGTGRDTECAG